jgi:hypothetical protein
MSDEPSFTLTEILEHVFEVRGKHGTAGDAALVHLIAHLIGIPDYDQDALAAVRTTVLG